MEFWDYPTIRVNIHQNMPRFPRRPLREEYDLIKRMFYAESLKSEKSDYEYSILDSYRKQLDGEYQWELANRPYYTVYPAIIPLLLRVRMDKVDSTALKLPIAPLCLRFSKSQRTLLIKETNKGDRSVRSILAFYSNYQYHGKTLPGVSLFVDCGETEKSIPILCFQNIPQKQGMSLEEAFEFLPYDPNAFTNIELAKSLHDCLRLLCTICLLDQDESVIEPEVLTADQDKFKATKDRKFIEKAYKRGKVGWSIGKHIDVVPHVRSASPFAL